MYKSTRMINIQVQSFGNYLRDIWIFALIFVLIQNQTAISLPIIWIGIQVIISVVSLLVFRKTGPNMVLPFILPSLILLLLFLFGSPFWLFLIGALISIWRLQARFNTSQNGYHLDSSFMLIFFATFLLVHFVSFILEHENYQYLLYTVFLTGIALFMGIRLFSILGNTDKSNSISKAKIFVFYLGSIVCLAGLSVCIYFIAPIIRKGIDILLVFIFSVLIIPFRPLIEYLENFMSGLQIKEIEESERLQVGEQSESKLREPITEEMITNFPFEWILFGIGTIASILLVRYLLKNKPEKLELEQVYIQYENEEMNDEEEKKKSQLKTIYKVETSLLRERYLQFEVESHSFDLGRKRDETVREWFNKMGWKVNDEFFQIYEEVRYGGHTIATPKAEVFIKTLNEIKNKFFIDKDV